MLGPIAMSVEFSLGWIRSRLGCDKATDRAADKVAVNERAEGLAALAEVAILIGTPVDCSVLAKVLDMARHELELCLNLLVLDGRFRVMNGVYECVGAPRATTILPDIREAVHRRAGECLAELTQSANCEQASVIANHFEVGGCWLESFDWWREATERAVADGQLRTALGFIERALSICSLHPGSVPLESELAALNSMGPIRAQIDGSGAHEVAAIYERCAALAAQPGVGETASSFNFLWGLTACILVHGRIDTARELCTRLMRIAQASQQPSCIILGARLRGLGSFLAGDLEAAIDDFTTVQRLYDRKRHAAMRFKFASDQGAVALAHKAWAETIAGREEESERTGEAALELSRILRHPHTSAHVACVLAARAQILQQGSRAAPLAIAANALAKRHDFAYWQAWSELILAWHSGSRNPREGIKKAKAAIAAYRRTGATQALPYAHMLLADLALLASDYQLCLAVAETALATAASCGVRIFEAEILRMKALAVGPGQVRKALLVEAAVTARLQGALLFESRILAVDPRPLRMRSQYVVPAAN